MDGMGVCATGMDEGKDTIRAQTVPEGFIQTKNSTTHRIGAVVFLHEHLHNRDKKALPYYTHLYNIYPP